MRKHIQRNVLMEPIKILNYYYEVDLKKYLFKKLN